MIQRTPEQQECYTLLEETMVPFGKKYVPILKILQTTPVSIQKENEEKLRRSYSTSQAQEDSLVKLCEGLLGVIPRWSLISQNENINKKDDSYDVYRIYIGEFTAIEEPKPIHVAIWLEIQRKYIQDAIKRIETSIKNGISAENLKRFFIDMEAEFNQLREAILNHPYLVLPDTFTEWVQSLEKYYSELVLLQEISDVDNKAVEELKTVIELLRRILEHDFSQKRDEGLKMLLELDDYLQKYFIISARDSSREVFKNLKRKLEYMLFKQK